MTRRRKTRDFGALIGESAQLLKDTQAVTTLALDQLRPMAGQPRRVFAQAALDELAGSIRERGILQPLLVRPAGEGYEIVAGERRWRAAELAELRDVPVIVRELTDDEARVAALLENLQREDLNLIDEVDAKLDLLAATLGLGRDEARGRLMQLVTTPGEEGAKLDAVFTGMRESWPSFVKNKLKILNWPPALLEALRSGLPRTLVQLLVNVPEAHHAPLLDLIRREASRRELEAEITRLTQGAAGERTRAAQIGKVLGSRKWSASLTDREAKDVERWLEKAPAAVKRALEPGA